jgi:CPA1 family monovalent cation:H+ antiporter
MNDFLNTETLIIELLVVVSIVAIVIRRLPIPYTVALVIVGLLFTFQPGLKIELTPELLLALFLPPLVFEAAFHVDLVKLRESLVPILVLAVPGVLITTGIVGFIISAGAGLALPVALVFGALISATDPVAVIALFRSLGAPRSLSTIVESESLLNDGTAIVVFNLALAAAVAAATGQGNQELNLFSAVIEFIRVSAGGLLIGAGLGWLVYNILQRVDDYLIEITLTTVLAFGAYLVAERLHFSGVLAVLGAGIINGNLGPKGMSPTTRIVLFNFWEYLAFLANSLVFLLIGLDVDLSLLVSNIQPIIIAVLAVLISRVVVVYGLNFLINMRGVRVPLPYQHVLFWGGLRGAVGLALALSLPASLAERDLLRVMAFGVVLFTLLFQGTTIRWLLKRLGLLRQEEGRAEYERQYGRLMMANAAREQLQQLHSHSAISSDVWGRLSLQLEDESKSLLELQKQLLTEQPALAAAELLSVEREMLRARRARLGDLARDGIISEVVYQELSAEVDDRLVTLENEKLA